MHSTAFLPLIAKEVVSFANLVKSVRNQCHGQRKSLTVLLNSRPSRRIELYTKVCYNAAITT